MEDNLIADDDGNGFSISHENSRIQQKISLVQQVLTMLEETISSAKSNHQKRQDLLNSRLNELELQLQNLKQEINRDKEDFNEISDSLENDIQRYLNLENKLITIDERSEEDYVVLPELQEKADIYVAQFLPVKYNDWQRLKIQSQLLNHSTQSSYRDSIAVKKYQVTVTCNGGANQRYLDALQKANALNIFLGKMHISESRSPPSRFAYLTWYKDQVSAERYAQKHYKRIIEEVFKQNYDEYKGRTIEVTETSAAIHSDYNSLSTELTIHVQAKTSSTLNVPRRITLYQFDDSTNYNSPSLTAFDVQTSPIPVVDAEPNGLSVKTINQETSKNINETSTGKPIQKRKPGPKSKTHQKQPPSEAFDVLSFIGLNTNETNRSTQEVTPSSNEPLQRNLNSEPGTSTNLCSLTNPVAGNVYREGLSSWALDFIKKKGIEKITDVQKEFIEYFGKTGDILYEGKANAGKTTGMVIALLNAIEPAKNCVQALIITSNLRSSKLIQKELGSVEGPTELCKRIDEIDNLKASRGNKSQPSACILVGTLQEMKGYVSKNLVQRDAIRFLILHKAAEIYGNEKSSQKERAMLVNQIVYNVVDATIKVIVIRRTVTLTRCVELDSFCRHKLRDQRNLLETVDISDWMGERIRNLSGGSKKSDMSNDCIPLRRNSNASISSTASTVVSYVSNSESFTSSVISADPEQTNFVDTTVIDTKSEVISELPITVLTKDGMALLGIYDDNSVMRKGNPDPGSLAEVTHLYASIEDGDDSNKITVISLLNLEQDQAIIFCDNRDKAELISTRLRQHNMWPQVLHEDVPVEDQRVILRNYRQASVCRVLVCTDFLISISLDSADVVVNFDLPKNNSIYRGRSGYAVRRMRNSADPNSKGVVVNLISDELSVLEEFESSLGIKIDDCNVE